MKKVITILFLSFLISNICYSQSGWFWQNPLPSFSSYQDVKFVNSYTGCAVGSNGTIVRTTDNGIKWSIVKESYYTSDTLFSICFVNQTTGFAVGCKLTKGLICKTTNSGENWIEHNTNRITILRSVYFTSENTGYAVGFYSTIFKTNNSGITWDTLYRSTQGNYLNVFFVNNNTGFIGSNGFMLKTTNAGINWAEVNINVSSHNISSVYFINQNTGFTSYSWSIYMSNGTVVLKTTNCGLTWNNYIMNGLFSGGRIKFCNLNTGYICGYISFLKTTNCGINWYQTIPISRSNANSLDLINDSVAFAVGWYGNILKGNIMTDSFTNVSSLSENQNQSIIFVNQYTGFIAGYDGILKTTNSGYNWQKLSSPYTSYTDISFSDVNNGYACTYEGNAIKTTNGGTNWEVLNYHNGHGTSFIYALSRDTVFCLPGNGSIVDRSVNGGLNWSSIEIANWEINLYGICFINSNTGYINLSQNGKIIKTTNSGNTWFIAPIDVEVTASRIKKIDSLNLYAAARGYGPLSGIIKSTNGGINWTSYGITSDYTNDAFFVDVNTGYYLTGGNNNSMNRHLWITTNGGLNWNQQILPFESINFLRAVRFLNYETGFIIGYCSILKTTNGGFPIGIKNKNFEIPQSFSLSQNYPNPFNPVTRIKFSLPVPSKGGAWKNVRLVIYDILGREVETLIPPLGGGQEGLKPGSYEVTWDGSRYASGVYFYKLVTDEYVETKKMVLIK